MCSFQNLFFREVLYLKHKKTFLLSDLDENPYLEFSTGINLNQLPVIIEETRFDNEISFEDLYSIAKGKKLIIPCFSLSTFFNKRLRKYQSIQIEHTKVAVIEDVELNSDILCLLKEIEHSDVYFLADFSGKFEVLLPEDKTEGITFNFSKLNELVFIRFESREIITFKY